MSGIFGTLGIAEAQADLTFVQTLGQSVVYDAVNLELERHNADMEAALSLFVEKTTSEFKQRYKLPGGGYLQPRGVEGVPGGVKAYGQWDVAYPLEDFGAEIITNDIALAYMSVAELNRHIDTVIIQDRNTVRREILKALFDNVERSFLDQTGRGTLLVEPIANGDTVTYPPVLGSDDEATENHFLESGYATASISDTNNPAITVRDELEEHFGTPTAGSNIVMLVPTAVGAKIESELTDFDAVTNRFIQPGADTDTVVNLPPAMPGRILGVSNGVWIVEWRQIPPNYAVAIHADFAKPLVQRIDPEYTGLGTGLQLVAKDEGKPLESSFYRHRFGFGAGNRLNAVVLEFGTGGTYTIPSGFSH